jgi:hypothetical protein
MSLRLSMRETSQPRRRKYGSWGPAASDRTARCQPRQSSRDYVLSASLRSGRVDTEADLGKMIDDRPERWIVALDCNAD